MGEALNSYDSLGQFILVVWFVFLDDSGFSSSLIAHGETVPESVLKISCSLHTSVLPRNSSTLSSGTRNANLASPSVFTMTL
jgi:hypothetical protein